MSAQTERFKRCRAGECPSSRLGLTGRLYLGPEREDSVSSKRLFQWLVLFIFERRQESLELVVGAER